MKNAQKRKWNGEMNNERRRRRRRRRRIDSWFLFYFIVDEEVAVGAGLDLDAGKKKAGCDPSELLDEGMPDKKADSSS